MVLLEAVLRKLQPDLDFNCFIYILLNKKNVSETSTGKATDEVTLTV